MGIKVILQSSNPDESDREITLVKHRFNKRVIYGINFDTLFRSSDYKIVKVIKVE